MDLSELSSSRVLIMGLGAHGGGAASARYCAEAGASVTVTDLRTEDELSASIASLADLPIRFVLGHHDPEDFRKADVVIKNPAVRRTAPLLREARAIETDISIFLREHTGPVLAITGTKGKSTTASALHHIVRGVYPAARLGGNITVSPLTFLRDLNDSDPVVLELSSFQLGDLLLTSVGREGVLPPFSVSIVTNLLPDHQDYYGSMEAYAADKALIFSGQQPDAWCVLSDGDSWSRAYRPPHPGRVVRVGAGQGLPPHACGPYAAIERGIGVFAEQAGVPVELVPSDTRVQGAHMRRNLLFAAVAARLFGVPDEIIRDRARNFAGVPHRLEEVALVAGIRWINDSAATIAEAASAAVESFTEPVHLIAGGSDKGVPLDAFRSIGTRVASLHLLAGSATERIVGILDEERIPYHGPYSDLGSAVDAAGTAARPGSVVLLSPGCASFGMFRNEFDRGDQFRRLVRERSGMIE
ncbi:MAG: UDP-N-acetylmuramoyl-L-alanine--D-glutamate ligase [Spirochaetota bacterium]